MLCAESYATSIASVFRELPAFLGTSGTVSLDLTLGRRYDSSQYAVFVSQIQEAGEMQVRKGPWKKQLKLGCLQLPAPSIPAN